MKKQTPQHGKNTIFTPSKKELQPDNLPKVGSKSYKDITAVSVLEIPTIGLKPINGRIIVLDTDPGEVKTPGGIIRATKYRSAESKGGKTRKLRRYYVIAVADDCTLDIARGDEVHPFIPDQAEDWSFTEVFDYYTNDWYYVFHETELAGITKTKLEDKEGK